MIVVRYADDFVVGFQHRHEAERFLNELRERFDKFGLALHPDKTRLIEFGRFAAENRQKRGEGKPETFDFLGFTHICARNAPERRFRREAEDGDQAAPCQAAGREVDAAEASSSAAQVIRNAGPSQDYKLVSARLKNPASRILGAAQRGDDPFGGDRRLTPLSIHALPSLSTETAGMGQLQPTFSRSTPVRASICPRRTI